MNIKKKKPERSEAKRGEEGVNKWSRHDKTHQKKRQGEEDSERERERERERKGKIGVRGGLRYRSKVNGIDRKSDECASQCGWMTSVNRRYRHGECKSPFTVKLQPSLREVGHVTVGREREREREREKGLHSRCHPLGLWQSRGGSQTHSYEWRLSPCPCPRPFHSIISPHKVPDMQNEQRWRQDVYRLFYFCLLSWGGPKAVPRVCGGRCPWALMSIRRLRRSTFYWEEVEERASGFGRAYGLVQWGQEEASKLQ